MTAASVASAEEICISTLDRTRGQCDNRTNVRELQGSGNMAVERDHAQDARRVMVEWLRTATKEEKCEMLVELTSFRDVASSQQRNHDPQE